MTSGITFASVGLLVSEGLPTIGQLLGHTPWVSDRIQTGLSAALSVRFAATQRDRTRKHSNNKRTLVTLTLYDGRSSQAGRRAFVAASKSTIPDPLGAKTPIATLHMQIVGQWVWGNFLCWPDSTPLSCCPWRPRHCPRAPN